MNTSEYYVEDKCDGMVVGPCTKCESEVVLKSLGRHNKLHGGGRLVGKEKIEDGMLRTYEEWWNQEGSKL